jgi:ectoine hydroxylase-related dioxygenase (phytanoyl-CoA dioxygenase family)
VRAIDPSFVDDATVAAYRSDGCCVVRGLFDADDGAADRAGIELNLAEPGPLFGVASRDDDPGRFVEDFCNWQRIDEYRRIAFESKAADVAGALMGSSVVRLYHDHMLVKEPGTRQPTPWHQDQPYYNVDGWDNVSMWMPVDPVAPESTLEFLAGSHRRGWLMPRTFLTEQAKWFPEGTLEELPDVESDRSAHEIRGWAMQPGDAVFFHMLTAHHAYGVPGANRRRAFSLRFLGDDATHAPRPWRTSPQFDGLEDELPAGAPMEHPLFPVLRQSVAWYPAPVPQHD